MSTHAKSRFTAAEKARADQVMSDFSTVKSTGFMRRVVDAMNRDDRISDNVRVICMARIFLIDHPRTGR